MDLTAGILQGGTFLAAVAIVVWKFVSHRSYRKLILQTWGWMIVWAFVNCFFFPLVFSSFYGKAAWKYFPEPPGLVGVVAVGWIAGIQLAILIGLGRMLWRFFAWARSLRKEER